MIKPMNIIHFIYCIFQLIAPTTSIFIIFILSFELFMMYLIKNIDAINKSIGMYEEFQKSYNI